MNWHPETARYEAMTYNRCGRSGLLLPAVSLGLWHNFGGVDCFETGRRMVRLAFDHGVTHFDLANNYGPPPGSAEENFGVILRKDLAAHRDELVISTKAGYRMWPGPYGEWGSRKSLLASLDQSLRRLGLEYVDIFYSHRPDPATPIEETMQTLDSAVRQGKALYVGVSSYSVEQTRAAIDTLRRLGTPCLIHQPMYSMLNRWVEDGLLDLLGQEGIGCIAFSPLAHGLLTDRYLAAKPHGFLNKEEVTKAVVAKMVKLHSIAKKRGQTLAQMALAWVLRNERMTSALIGASKVEQIEQNVGALKNLEFTEKELHAIDAAAQDK